MIAPKCLFLLLSYSVANLGETKKSSIFAVRPLFMRMAYFGLSEDNPPDTAMKNVSIQYVGTKAILNFIFFINRDIKSFEKGILNIRRCTDQAEEKNCEHFQTWRFENICILMIQKNMIWSPLVNSISPKVRCPIRKDIYTINNGTLDVQVIQKVFYGIPVENYFWRVRAEGYDRGSLWVSAIFGIRYLRGKA